MAGRTISQPFTLRMDPRIKTALAGLAEQYAVASKLADALTRTFDSWQREADASRKRDLARLHADLMRIYELVEGTDAAPTPQAVRAATAALARAR